MRQPGFRPLIGPAALALRASPLRAVLPGASRMASRPTARRGPAGRRRDRRLAGARLGRGAPVRSPAAACREAARRPTPYSRLLGDMARGVLFISAGPPSLPRSSSSRRSASSPPLASRSRSSASPCATSSATSSPASRSASSALPHRRLDRDRGGLRRPRRRGKLAGDTPDDAGRRYPGGAERAGRGAPAEELGPAALAATASRCACAARHPGAGAGKRVLLAGGARCRAGLPGLAPDVIL